MEQLLTRVYAYSVHQGGLRHCAGKLAKAQDQELYTLEKATIVYMLDSICPCKNKKETSRTPSYKGSGKYLSSTRMGQYNRVFLRDTSVRHRGSFSTEKKRNGVQGCAPGILAQAATLYPEAPQSTPKKRCSWLWLRKDGRAYYQRLRTSELDAADPSRRSAASPQVYL